MKQHLARIATTAAGWLPDALMLAGAASVSWGASLVYLPAGWIVAGLFLIVAGVLAVKGGR